MKIYSVIFVCAILPYLVIGAPQDVQVVDYENNNDGLGNYNYKYSLSDETKVEQTGELKQVQGADDNTQAVVMTGSFEFRDTDGNVHRVSYTADENGFHPNVES